MCPSVCSGILGHVVNYYIGHVLYYYVGLFVGRIFDAHCKTWYWHIALCRSGHIVSFVHCQLCPYAHYTMAMRAHCTGKAAQER